jgi:DNA-directed RNA polymerase specialized sigma24 family protein
MAEAALTFEEFAAARLPAVLRFAGVLTGDRGLAEDVVQEVLLRASGRWESIAGLDWPEAYIRKMIVNEYLSWRRRSWRLVPSGAGTEIADALGCAAGTVRGYASRALAMLRVEMSDPAQHVIKERS